MSVGLADLPQLVLESVLVRHTKLVLLAWRQGGINSLCGPAERLLIEHCNLLGPLPQLLVLWEILFHLMPIA